MSNDPPYLADASALRQFAHGVSIENRTALWTGLTGSVEDHKLGFPKEVAEHLAVIARDEQSAAWAAAQGERLTEFAPNIKDNRQLMAMVADLGFDAGFESIDDKEPGIVCLARLACERAHERKPFTIVSEDTGAGPLAPTMEQLCRHADWAMIDAATCLDLLGLGGLLQ